MINRILIATGIYPPDIGGPATHSKKLAEEFAKQGFSVDIVTYGRPENPKAYGVSRKIPFGLRHFIYFLVCLRLAVKCDVIFAQDAAAAGLPAALAAKLLRKKFFIRIGGDLLWERVVESEQRIISFSEYYQGQYYLTDRPILFRVIRYVLKSADAVVVVTQLLKDAYEKHYGVAGARIRVILNPVELKAMPKAASAAAESIILFTGRFVAYKNLKHLMRVFDKVRQKLHKGRLILTGAGPQKDELVALAKSLPSKDYIQIFPSFSREKLLAEIDKAAVCVAPALTEFNPNFILECLSADKPALLSRENGLTVKLPEEFLFDPKNENELERKLTHLLDPQNYRRAVAAIPGLAPHPTWQTVVNEYLSLLKKL